MAFFLEAYEKTRPLPLLSCGALRVKYPEKNKYFFQKYLKVFN